jgi:hypothetical protein
MKPLFLALAALTPAIASAQIIRWSFDDSRTPTPQTFTANLGTLGSTYDLRTFVSNNNQSTTRTNAQAADSLAGSAFAFDLTSTGSMGSAHGAFGDIATAQSGLTGLSSMTVSGWFNASSAPTSGATLIRASSGSNNGWQITFTAETGQLRLNVGDGTGSTNYNSNINAFSTATGWQFFAVSWTSTGGATWFRGTDSIGATAVGTTTTARTMNTNSFAVSVGRGNSGTGNSFHGYLDDLRVYGSALNLASIEEIRTVNAIPEPSSFATFAAAAALGFACLRRRRARA